MSQETLRILVVDDDLDTCRNLEDILTEMGYLVKTAQSGEAALDLVRQEPFDVALLDFKMPGMDGLTLYRKIRKLRSGTVALIITAYSTPETASEALKAGAWQVMSKPVDFSQLFPLLEEAAGQPLVMVVDDDHDLCENLWDLLHEQGYRVSTACGEAEAEENLKGQDFQVVLIDLKLHEGDGRNVLKTVKQLNPEARTLLITGYRDELTQMVEETLKEGADGVCYKPFDVPQLLELLRQMSISHE
jgi:DNA-binding NtrC family response regulator